MPGFGYTRTAVIAASTWRNLGEIPAVMALVKVDLRGQRVVMAGDPRIRWLNRSGHAKIKPSDLNLILTLHANMSPSFSLKCVKMKQQ